MASSDQTSGENPQCGEETGQKTNVNASQFRFIKGFIHRDKPLCPDNEEFVVFVRKNYILNLRYHVPKNVLDKRWLRPPGILQNVRTPLGLALQGAWALEEFVCVYVDIPRLGRAALAMHVLAR